MTQIQLVITWVSDEANLLNDVPGRTHKEGPLPGYLYCKWYLVQRSLTRYLVLSIYMVVGHGASVPDMILVHSSMSMPTRNGVFI